MVGKKKTWVVMVVKLELNRITELSKHDGYSASAVVTI